MTTKKEWAIGIVGGLILVAILLIAPPWMVIPGLAVIYIIYRVLDTKKPEAKTTP